jgi:outer membrane protein OmpA-like peptidoglycan-associated protein
MKKISLSIAFVFAVLSLFAQTQERPTDLSRWSMGVKGGIDYFRVYPYADNAKEVDYFIKSNYALQASWTAPSLFLEYSITPYFGIGLDAGYFAYNRGAKSFGGIKGRTIDAALYGSVNLSNLISPQRVGFWRNVNLYANAGLGAGFYKYEFGTGQDGNSISPMALTALNLAFNLGKAWELSLEGAYRYYTKNDLGGLNSPDKGIDALAATIGFRYKFNANKKTHVRNMLPTEYYPLPAPVVIHQDSDVKVDPAIYDRLKGVEDETKAIKDKLQQLEDDLKALADKTNGLVTASFQNIEFEFGSYKLTSASKKVLDQIITILNNNPTWENLKVVGHTDNIGTAQVNQKLSEDRANAVKDYLIKSGNIAANKISTTGYGFDKPIASNDTVEGRQKNRRVEFEISK